MMYCDHAKINVLQPRSPMPHEAERLIQAINKLSSTIQPFQT